MNIKTILMAVVLVCIFGNIALAQSADNLQGLAPADRNGDAAILEVGSNFGGPILAPLRFGDKLFYTVYVPTKAGKVSRIYSTAIGKSKAHPMPINPKDDQVHIAHIALNVAANRIYFTQTREAQPGKHSHSELWYRDKTYEGDWGAAVKLPAHINKQGSSSQQPSVGFDFNLKKEILFYASNRPDGKGGFDIWYCTVERDGGFGEPVNLVMNSTADEVTPYYFPQKQLLFYSSNFYGGKGGFDIYQTVRDENGLWTEMENMEQVNTKFDELYFTYHHPSLTSYFCSNRPIGNSENAVNGSTDFSIFTTKIGGNMVVNILSQRDSAAIIGCNIELEDVSEGTVQNVVTEAEANTLLFPIFPDKKYRLIVSKMGYFPVFIELQTATSNCFQTITQKVMMKPMK